MSTVFRTGRVSLDRIRIWCSGFRTIIWHWYDVETKSGCASLDPETDLPYFICKFFAGVRWRGRHPPQHWHTLPLQMATRGQDSEAGVQLFLWTSFFLLVDWLKCLWVASSYCSFLTFLLTFLTQCRISDPVCFRLGRIQFEFKIEAFRKIIQNICTVGAQSIAHAQSIARRHTTYVIMQKKITFREFFFGKLKKEQFERRIFQKKVHIRL